MKLNQMLHRIDILKIIKAHAKTLRSLNQTNDDKSIYIHDVVTFFIIPLILSYILYLLELQLISQVSNLIAIISIFGGFLFNLLAIIYSYLEKIKSSTLDEVKKIFANEINANISFCILLSIFLVLILLIYSFFPSNNCGIIVTYISQFIEYSIYYLLILFFLTLLMVLSRIFVLLEKE